MNEELIVILLVVIVLMGLTVKLTDMKEKREHTKNIQKKT